MMKKQFNTLTKSDVEMLRRKPVSVASNRDGVLYNFTQTDVDAAIKHLRTLYTGTIKTSFAAKILLLNEIY
ncbi:MAG: hypothetical protein SOY47_14685 [Lachnospiraceae bacterium]|nr:hypothetical protein [Lachnospiraceae bacterium]